MKKFLITICACICIVGVAIAETLNVTWYNTDGTTYDTTTCTVGGTLTLPSNPTRYGYTFLGWAIYTPIEYLESTGTQAIDTGIKFSGPNARVVIKFALTNGSGTTTLSGAEYYQNGWVFVPQVNNNSVRFFHHSTCDGCGSMPLEANRIYVLDMQQQNGYFKVLLDDIEKINQQNPNISTTAATYSLFADKYSNGSYTAKSRQKIYHAQIYDNGTLVRDMIPVLDPDGIPCMYDKVSATFFYNAGTGNFIAGPVVGSE